VHENGSVAWKPATRAMLRDFPVTRDPFSKSSFVKEKKIKQAGYSDSYSSILSSALHVNLRGSFPHQEPGVPFLLVASDLPQLPPRVALSASTAS